MGMQHVGKVHADLNWLLHQFLLKLALCAELSAEYINIHYCNVGIFTYRLIHVQYSTEHEHTITARRDDVSNLSIGPK